MLVILIMVSTIKVRAQSVYNYFSREIGAYAQVTFGQNCILFSIPPNGNIRLNFSEQKNNMLFYSYNDFIVAMSSDASYLSVISNGQVTRFTCVGPVSERGNFNRTTHGENDNSDIYSRKQKCYFCNGTGKVTKNDQIPQYSTNDYYVYKTCSECGWEYNSTITNHYHATSSNCSGKGYVG